MIIGCILSTALANSSISFDEAVLDLKKDIYVYSRNINVKIMHHNNADLENNKKPEYILNKFVEYTVAYNNKYKITNNPTSDCSSDTLNIIYVSEEYLNDPFRLKVWFGDIYSSKFEGKKLIGLYDYRYYESNIYITDSRYEDDGITFEERLAHEISHFWYKKSCLDPNHSDNEDRALEFESLVE